MKRLAERTERENPGGRPLRSIALALGAACWLLGVAGCKSDPPGTVNLQRLGLDAEEDHVSGESALPAVGTEYFLAVTDLGTCLPCKKSAIWISRVWNPKRRPRRLVFLDTLGSEFDREATGEFVEEKGLRGTHYICDDDCLDRLSDRLGGRPDLPAYYFIGADGLIHWKGGYQPAYSPVFHAIRSGQHELPLSMKTLPATEEAPAGGP